MDLFHQLDKILFKLKWKFVNEAGMIELEHFLKLFNLHKDKKKTVVEVLGQLRVLQESNTSLIQAEDLTLQSIWEFYTRYVTRTSPGIFLSGAKLLEADSICLIICPDSLNLNVQSKPVYSNHFFAAKMVRKNQYTKCEFFTHQEKKLVRKKR